MKFWFDTEFLEDGKTIELISIGIKAEDGREYYAETPGAERLCSQSDWLMVNVMPHLLGVTKGRSTIAREIVEFVGQNPEFWAYYADYDWVALCQLYGRMIDLPEGWPMFCCDLKQLCVMLGDPKLPKQKSAEHNALADAVWTAEAHRWVVERQIALENPLRGLGPVFPVYSTLQGCVCPVGAEIGCGNSGCPRLSRRDYGPTCVTPGART